MARLPSALRSKEERVEQMMRMRKENLERLSRGTAPAAGAAEPSAAPAAAAPEPPPPLPAERSAAAASTEELRRLEARNATTEGMLRKVNEERQAAEEAARRAREDAQVKAELLAEARARLAQAPAPAAPLSAEELRRHGIGAAQLEEFGEEHCRLIVALARNAAGEVSRSAVQAEVQALRGRLEQAEAQLQQEHRRRREADFVARLDAALPRWREVNANPEFLRWLGERDPLRGVSRQQMLSEAEGAQDAPRVCAILNAWLQPQPRAAARTPANRVLPNGRPPADTPTERVSPQTVSRAWIAEQNRLFSQGYYRRRPAEWQAIQDTIDKAARDGRIR